ncbi:MAG: hypothetical protein E5W13_07920 [Mesorhizobium sp.]|nr:MAG: hypothetical protein E5W13_07920 [Mesorhizobium sp.]
MFPRQVRKIVAIDPERRIVPPLFGVPFRPACSRFVGDQLELPHHRALNGECTAWHSAGVFLIVLELKTGLQFGPYSLGSRVEAGKSAMTSARVSRWAVSRPSISSFVNSDIWDRFQFQAKRQNRVLVPEFSSWGRPETQLLLPESSLDLVG